jgi:type IV secretion system protein VirB10
MSNPKIPPAKTLVHDDKDMVSVQEADSIDHDAGIQKGMPSRNLKTIAVMGLLFLMLGYMFISNNREPKQQDAPINSSTDNVIQDLVKDLKDTSRPYQPEEIVPPMPAPVVKQAVTEVDEREQAALLASMKVNDVNVNKGAKQVQSEKQTAEDRFRAIMAEQRQAAEAFAEKQSAKQTEMLRTMGVDPTIATAAIAGNGGPMAAGIGLASSTSVDHNGFIERQARNSQLGAATKLNSARKAHTLYEGTIIRATLTRALKTDLPGMITAKVSSDLYDTLTQKVVLVPRGSEITCTYQNALMVGQKLVLAACTRLRLPNGKSFSLNAAPASDMQGASGMPADIDNHFWEMFSNALIVGAASYLLPEEERRITKTTTVTGTDIAGSIMGSALGKVVDATIGRNINIPPTGTVDIGTPFTLTLSRDVEMEPYFVR